MDSGTNYSVLVLDFKKETLNYCISYTYLGEEK